jgi:hypothetical protein
VLASPDVSAGSAAKSQGRDTAPANEMPRDLTAKRPHPEGWIYPTKVRQRCLRVSFSRVLLVLVVLAGCGGDIDTEGTRVSAGVRDVPSTVLTAPGRASLPVLREGKQVTTTTTVPAFVAGKPFADAVIRQAIAVAEKGREPRAPSSESGETLPAAPTADPIPAAASSVPTSPQPAGYPTAVVPPDLVPMARCIIDHESAQAGVYLAVNPNGVWRGAYQMDRQFWEAYAPAKWKHLAGQHELAPPEAQDAAFVAGYRARGSQPWNGSGC